MKKFLSISSKIIVSVGLLGSIAGGAYFIYSSLNRVEYDTYSPKSSNKLDEYDLKVTEDWKLNPYLGEEGLELLKKKIQNEINFGPEIVGLNSINITDDPKYVQSENNGTFYTATKSIFINSKNLSNMVPYESSVENKVNVTFQIIFHEYGHYIADSYFKKEIPSDGNAADIYLHRNEYYKEGWNKDFVDNFKNYLNYNSENLYTPKLDTSGMHNTLASVYSLKELFDKSNGIDKTVYEKPLSNLIWSGGVVKSELKYQQIQPDTLMYLYDLNELFTRKYQQMMMSFQGKPRDSFKDDVDIGGLTTRGLIYRGGNGANKSWSVSPFMLDTLKYQNENASGIVDRFYDDSPYDLDPTNLQRTEGLFNIFLKGVGQDTGSDISFITTQNNSEMTGFSNYVDGDSNDLIKFGGFIKKDENYSHVGYMEGENFIPFKIHKHKYNVGFKETLIGPISNYAENENYFYTTENWIDGNVIKNKTLYFSDDAEGTNKVKMKSVKGGTSGAASTWYYETPKVLQDKIFTGIIDADGNVSIKEDAWKL